jgi:hypothetical protein
MAIVINVIRIGRILLKRLVRSIEVYGLGRAWHIGLGGS